MSNINLIDPNNFTDANNQTNLQMPAYEDMHIFVELTSYRRERTVLQTNMNITNLVLPDHFGDDSKVYNLLGSNANNEFTTNWSAETSDNSNLEGFGIESIKVTINSSFIPQVDIKFVDYRGRTFFNNDNSPYRMLFDFPPPIFKLTIKGYYGLGSTYLLHLVKYNTEFKSDNGFFYIEANFVALTFAPLADIPFRYIIQFAMLDDQIAIPAKNIPPKNTYDLILKIKSLYSKIPQQINDLEDTRQLKDIIDMNLKIEEAETLLSIMKDTDILNQDSILFKLTTSDNDKIEPINQISNYLAEINLENNATPLIQNKQLCIGYIYDLNLLTGASMKKDDYERKLTSFKSRLWSILAKTGAGITQDELVIKPLKKYNDNKDLILYEGSDYIYLNLTTAYIKLQIKKQINIKRTQQLNSKISLKINNLIYTELGMLPTIYNIFNIILKDVDTFFTQLRNYSTLAETHHDKYIDSIVNDLSLIEINKKKLYSFPLVINTVDKTRIAPIEISNKSPERFPELVLIDKFFKSFGNAENIRKSFEASFAKDAKGNNTWIPITPKDSSLYVYNTTNPFLGANLLDQLFRININRFYVYNDIIFDRNIKSDNLIISHAEGEANNLFNAILKIKAVVFNNISSKTDEWIARNNFIDYIQTNLPDLYSIDTDRITLNENTGIYYVDKRNNSYDRGFYITKTNNISVQTPTEEPFFDSLVKYLDIFKSKKYIKDITINNIKLTTENLIYIPDKLIVRKEGGVATYTTYTNTILGSRYNNALYLSVDDISVAKNKGNKGFNDYIDGYGRSNNSYFSDIYEGYANLLYKYKDLYKSLDTYKNDTTVNQYLKMLVIVSNFGNVASPFSCFDHEINQFFTIPSVIEIPGFVHKYISVLAHAVNSGSDLIDIVNSFIEDKGPELSNKGVMILADIYDITKTISVKDRNIFITEYPYDTFMDDFVNLNSEIEGWYSQLPALTITQLTDNLKNSDIFNSVLFKKVNLLNFDENTFKLEDNNKKNENVKIRSIKTLYNNGSWDKNTKLYFDKFLKKLQELINKKNTDDKNKIVNGITAGGDPDLINQTYYSFKTINDKWLSDININTANKGGGGYPFNIQGKNLIDSFAFIDRTMNPIGETIINPEILGEMMDDPDKSVLTVLSTLLSLNHFEFFPLQNFIYDNGNNWQDTMFSINNNTILNTNPSFVCMYLGGSSSYPTGIEQYGFYNEDGILNLETELDTTYRGKDTDQIPNNPNFPWGNVKGFKVKFGEQNQSIFTDMKVDSKEYPETNESIQILAKLAGDNTNQEPAPKAQNLYNLYENRAYKATIGALGNVMIQPSQYFQLENIPMFNGAYMILGVEHNIQNNRMITSFTGTKILKYPVPRVVDAATVFGFGGGSSTATATGDIPDSSGNLNNDTNIFSNISDTLDKLPIPINAKKLTVNPISGNLINSNTVTSVTGYRSYNKHVHKGIDFGVPIGTPVYAVADGIIVLAEKEQLDPDKAKVYNSGNGLDYGNTIIIDHGTGFFADNSLHLYTRYGHLSPLTEIKFNGKSIEVNKTTVKAGDIIANSGNSGVGGEHLHFGIYQGNYIGKYKYDDYAVNPTNYFDNSTEFYRFTISRKNK